MASACSHLVKDVKSGIFKVNILKVFIRELVSNASDALEKRRCKHLESGEDASIPYEIKITTDESSRLIVFEDNGIGMDREDLVNCLGTIAKSGELIARLTFDLVYSSLMYAVAVTDLLYEIAGFLRSGFRKFL